MPFAYPVKRNLILVAQPEYLQTDDLVQFREKIRSTAPDVRVFIVGRADNARLISNEVWNHATLTVSFGPLGKFTPLRGPVMYNRALPKLEQYERMAAAGIATPRTAVFRPGMELREEEWGAFCVLKPARLDITSSGSGLYLFRTRRLSGLQVSGLPEGHLARLEPMLVQSFVDTGPRFTVYRCLTLFDEVIYQNVSQAPEPHPALESDDSVVEAMLPEPPRAVTTPRIDPDPDVMAFGITIHTAFPDFPLLGCDILKEHETGRLYALEVNAGGNVWHLSSPRTRAYRSVTRVQEYLRTFRCFDRAAAVLVRATRRFAR